MCGIAGFVGRGDRDILLAMTRCLVHRGPDGVGLYDNSELNIFLGHTRLAVVDLEHGHQPMWSGDGDICVVFNGEIYNHVELRAELEAKGHCFATDHSDTEVLIYGYRQWGEALWGRLNGMFAACLFDRKAECLVLARDRMGEKPLYYVTRPGLFSFASEPSALFAHPQIQRELDARGVQKFFAYGYSPSESTVFRDLRKLRPGEVICYDLSSKRVRSERFFTFRIEPSDDLARRTDAQLAEELAELIDRAVAARLRADVPVGVLLSGGVDSSTVLSSACSLRAPETIDAFTIGFRESSFDESPFAEVAARHVRCRHHIKVVTVDNARDVVAPLFQHLGEPFGDPSIVPTSILSKFAREKVTVALSGDGGDELFAGYDPFIALRYARIYQALVPTWLHDLARSAAAVFPISDKNMSLDFKLRRTLIGMSYPSAIRLPVWMSPIEPRDLVNFFSDPLPEEDLYSEAIEVWSENITGSDVDRALEFYTRLYLPDDILFKSDRASMMHGLELRAVFLDNAIVDFVRRLPAHYKLRHRTRKWLLKKAVASRLPPELSRRRKKGFGIPLATWLREMNPPLHSRDSSICNATINANEVRRRWCQHRDGKIDERYLLWSVLSLEESTRTKLPLCNPP